MTDASGQLDSSLQNILKRVSREIHVRKTGRNNTKQPLPPLYERIGNSIAYQLLLQAHSTAITAELINSIYPALKLLEDRLPWLFTDYLEKFDIALRKKATPDCLHPPDIPSIHFLSELCVHTASLPERPHHLTPNPALWMEILAIFSISPQNQQVLIDYRCPSKIVGCMNLTNMADNRRLQCQGWRVLSNIVGVPTPEGKKPGVHIQAVTLLLSHVKRQLEQFNHLSDLTVAIVTFLVNLSTIVRQCGSNRDLDPKAPYDPDYANNILQLFEDFCLRKVLLDLPEHVKEYEGMETMLQTILAALEPISSSSKPRKSVPPPKPKRSRCRTQLFSSLSASSLPSVDILTEPVPQHHRQLTTHLSKTSITHSKSTENVNIADNSITAMSLPAHLAASPRITHRKNPLAYVAINPESRLSDPLSQSLPSYRSSIASFPSSLSSHQSSQSPIPLILCDDMAVTPVSHAPSHSILEQEDIDGPQNGEPTEVKGMHGNSQWEQQSQLSRSRRGTYLKAVTSSQIIFGDSQEPGKDIAMSKKQELLSDIGTLWSTDKALHAASSAVCACFIDSTTDLVLFMECLKCFCSEPNRWTLGAAIILLPSIREVIKSNPPASHVGQVCDALTIMLQHCVHRNGKNVSVDDTEGDRVFYYELYLLFAVASKIFQSSNDQELQHKLSSVISLLRPFADPIQQCIST